MADTIYWIARSALVLAWLGVAWAAWRRPTRGLRWRGIACWALVVATMRAWPWNYELLLLARRVMLAAGVYDDRIWGKVALGAAVFCIVLAAILRLRHVRDGAVALVLLGLGLQTVLLAIETFSIEAMLPAALVQQPGRYLLEGSFAACALIGVLRARRSAAADGGAAGDGAADGGEGEVA